MLSHNTAVLRNKNICIPNMYIFREKCTYGKMISVENEPISFHFPNVIASQSETGQLFRLSWRIPFRSGLQLASPLSSSGIAYICVYMHNDVLLPRASVLYVCGCVCCNVSRNHDTPKPLALCPSHVAIRSCAGSHSTRFYLRYFFRTETHTCVRNVRYGKDFRMKLAPGRWSLNTYFK